MELQVDTMVKINKWVDTEKGKCSKGIFVCLKSVVILQSTSSDWNLGT